MHLESGELRVVLLLSELHPGGMEKVVVLIANGLVERGHSVMVVCLQAPGEFSSILDSKVKFIALESYGSKDFNAVLRLRKILMEFNPSVINIHDYTSLPYLIIANFIGRKTPVIFTAHGELYEGFESLRKRLRFFSKGLSGLTGVSSAIVDYHKRFLAWTGQTWTLKNGIHPVHINKHKGLNFRGELGCANDDFLFLAIGNPRIEKAFEDLIDAVFILSSMDRSLKFKVIIAGALNDSPYCKMLFDKLREKRVERWCRFIGFKKDVTLLYSAADAFVLSSRSEGLPMVILEAMMAGLPVVSTKVGGIPDAVGQFVLLTDAGDPEQLAQGMRKMMSDSGIRDQLAKEGQTHVRHNFGVDRMVADYLACYNAIIEKKKHITLNTN